MLLMVFIAKGIIMLESFIAGLERWELEVDGEIDNEGQFLSTRVSFLLYYTIILKRLQACCGVLLLRPILLLAVYIAA
jgi:hypothetical protein